MKCGGRVASEHVVDDEVDDGAQRHGPGIEPGQEAKGLIQLGCGGDVLSRPRSL